MRITKGQISLPEGWHEVTLCQFMEIKELDLDEYRTNSVIAILTNEDDELINKLTKQSKDQIVSKLTWTNQLPPDNFYKREIIIDEVEYYLRDLTELTNGEWIDLNVYFKNPFKNLHKICSIFYQPLKKVNSNTLSDLFYNKMFIGDVFGVLVFFCLIANKSILTMNNYLATLIMEGKN